MNKLTIITKCKKVIENCENIKQLETAHKYMCLTINNLNNSLTVFYDSYKKKYKISQDDCEYVRYLHDIYLQKNKEFLNG